MTVVPSVATALPKWPYPGLRPFDENEWAIYFGRERIVDEVIGRLAGSRLVLIHGVSGSGKSSLVRAGVLPKLALQYNRHGAPWLTCAMRPSGGPLWNLAREFAWLERRGEDLERVSAIAGQFNARSATLSSVAASLEGVEGKSLCLLVDQFEELFRYSKDVSRDEAELFVDLIEGAARGEGREGALDAINLHVIVTMRSEFLGECSRFARFAETVNRTQYLVPRMDDDGLMRAVRRPAQMYGGEFEEGLAERLIDSVRGREDELPLLQHGLMGIWEEAARRAKPGERVRLDGSKVDEAGGLAELLSKHADEVMALVVAPEQHPTLTWEQGDRAKPEERVPEERRERIVEAVFRALTDVNAEGLAIRRPLAFRRLCAVTGAKPEELRPILDAFRAPGVSFVTPYAPLPIDEKTPIDVSHEALIRCWHKIIDKPDGWLRREIRDGLAWRALLYQAQRFAGDRSNFLSASMAETHAEWLTERNEAWADLYGSGWPEVATLISASRAHWRRMFLDTTPYGADKEDSITDTAENAAVTTHSATIGGVTFAYTAIAGHLVAVNPVSSRPAARFFYVAFTADGSDPNARPVTFFCNGGPGSSSVLTLLGSFAPRRIRTFNPPPPYAMADNPDSLLDCSDLVFVNSVGTAYSAAIAPFENRDFWGVDQDARSLKQFIKRYLTANSRWNSPKFLFGESYGAVRACVLAWMLHQDGIDLNGVVLQSSILDYGKVGNAVGLLPTLAADAWFHHKVTISPFPRDLPSFLKDVERFARGKYANGLSAPRIDPDVLKDLSDMLGIPADALKHWNIDPSSIKRIVLSNLMQAQGLVVSAYDGRVVGKDGTVSIDPKLGGKEPTLTAVVGHHTTLWNVYLSDELRFTPESPFLDLTDQEWDFSHVGPDGTQMVGLDSLYTASDLAAAMAANPCLEVFSANGYYDAIAPYFQTILDFEAMPLSGARDLVRITVRNYPSGHTVFLDNSSRTAMKANLAGFYAKAMRLR